MSESQLVLSFESQSRLKVRKVKWCRNKWNEHYTVYCIFITNMWNLTKKICETAQTANFSGSHWFSVEMVQKVPKLYKRKLIFLKLSSESWHPGLSEIVMVFHPSLIELCSYQSFAKVQLELWNARELAVLPAPVNIESEVSENIEGEISDRGNRIWFSYFSSLEILPLVLLVPGGRITLIKISLSGSFPAHIHSGSDDKVMSNFDEEPAFWLRS